MQRIHQGLKDLRSATGSEYSVALAQLRSSSSHQMKGLWGGTTTRFSWRAAVVEGIWNEDPMEIWWGCNGIIYIYIIIYYIYIIYILLQQTLAVSGSLGKWGVFLPGNGKNEVIQCYWSLQCQRWAVASTPNSHASSKTPQLHFKIISIYSLVVYPMISPLYPHKESWVSMPTA